MGTVKKVPGGRGAWRVATMGCLGVLILGSCATSAPVADTTTTLSAASQRAVAHNCAEFAKAWPHSSPDTVPEAFSGLVRLAGGGEAVGHPDLKGPKYVLPDDINVPDNLRDAAREAARDLMDNGAKDFEAKGNAVSDLCSSRMLETKVTSSTTSTTIGPTTTTTPATTAPRKTPSEETVVVCNGWKEIDEVMQGNFYRVPSQSVRDKIVAAGRGMDPSIIVGPDPQVAAASAKAIQALKHYVQSWSGSVSGSELADALTEVRSMCYGAGMEMWN